MDQVEDSMNAKEFYDTVVKMRHWQRECEKLNSTRNRTFRADAERIVDAEIERVTKIEQEQAEKQQKLL
ncbi:MAG: hypothetical protein J6U93_06005 [Alistipes sp.]|nr:hypothetical protein [Alistipes sp.]